MTQILVIHSGGLGEKLYQGEFLTDIKKLYFFFLPRMRLELEQIAQGGCGLFMTEDIQKGIRQNPKQLDLCWLKNLAYVGFTLSEVLDSMTSRNPSTRNYSKIQ